MSGDLYIGADGQKQWWYNMSNFIPDNTTVVDWTNVTNAPSGVALWTTNGTNIYNDTVSQVGIGTSFPDSHLHVNASQPRLALTTNFSTVDGNILGEIFFGDEVYFDQGGASAIKATRGAAWGTGNWDSQLEFYTSDSITALRAILTKNGDFNITTGELYVTGIGNNYFLGNVGIGTTQPTHTLNVVGNVNLTGNLTIEDQKLIVGASAVSDDTVNHTIFFGQGSPTMELKQYYTSSAVGWVLNIGGTTEEYRFSGGLRGLEVIGRRINITGSAGVLYAEGTGDSFFTGNLGIGTGNPSAKLNVVGNTSLEGYVLFEKQGTSSNTNSRWLIFEGVNSDTETVYMHNYLDKGNRIVWADVSTDIDAPTTYAMNLTQGGALAIKSLFSSYGSGDNFFMGGLGVGTKNPTDRLNVIGNMNLTGNLTHSDYKLTVGDRSPLDATHNSTVSFGIGSPLMEIRQWGTGSALGWAWNIGGGPDEMVLHGIYGLRTSNDINTSDDLFVGDDIFLEDRLVVENECGVASGTFHAEEADTLNNNSYEWSFGNGNTGASNNANGIVNPCSGVITAMAVQCDGCVAGKNDTVEIRIDNSASTCNVTINNTNPIAGGRNGLNSCSDTFNRGEILNFYTLVGDSCDYCTASMWLRYN
jgi:hypothetical protein